MEKVFLGKGISWKRYFLEYVYNDKSNVIQVLESDYIDSNCLA